MTPFRWVLFGILLVLLVCWEVTDREKKQTIANLREVRDLASKRLRDQHALFEKHLELMKKAALLGPDEFEAAHREALWEVDCFRWRGRPLYGAKSHWCPGWDGLPIDETCEEYPCVCWKAPEVKL